MKLRKLEEKDAELMLEWMHDPDVVEHLQTRYAEKTIEDCRAFIQAAQDTAKHMHLAIADEADTYMGTVSLKDLTPRTAEFAISCRRAAMGKGFSAEAMGKIIDIGFQDLALKKIFWCVSPENTRAVRFYDKNGYKRFVLNEDDEIYDFVKADGYYSDEQQKAYLWYKVEN